MKVYEKVYMLNNNFHHIRVWCAVKDLKEDLTPYLEEVAKEVYMNGDAAQIAERFAKLPYCNAVEVKHYHSNHAVLIYPDWP